MKLTDQPNWLYLLREFDAVYRRGSAGGSKPIRTHQRKVRELIGKVLTKDITLSERPPQTKPVVGHFCRAIDNAAHGPLAGLARALDRVSHLLHWEWGYERIAGNLANRYAYCDILGPRGSIFAENISLGLVLFAPGTIYPQHAHPDIEESYISISGSWSENDAAVYAPGSLILNRSSQHHRITVGDLEPCLLAYAWVAEPKHLAEPQMKFSRPKQKPA